MSERIGILYATVDGHTTKICNEIVKTIKEKNIDVQLFTIDNFTKNITDFDKFIIASSIRYGVHNKEIIAFDVLEQYGNYSIYFSGNPRGKSLDSYNSLIDKIFNCQSIK